MTWTLPLAVVLLFAVIGTVAYRSEKDKARLLGEHIAGLNGQIEILRQEKQTLLNTALEARGVAVVDAAGQERRQLVVLEQAEKRRRVAKVLTELEEKAAARARDRDERVREEIERTARLVEIQREPASEAK